jgi:pimeloyl-ACP methyl ester carboxylesterase
MKRALLATVLTVGATLAVGTATAQAETAEVGRVTTWQPCPENAEVQCAAITVPIDYARPRTGTIDVAVARQPATDPAHRIGVLFLMPGGPGGSGVDDLLSGRRGIPAELTARFDVVSFDPRGTNRSHPVVCDADLVANLVETSPEAGGTLADVQAYSRELGASCREHTGPLIDHVDTISYARDIDSIRAALGERQLTMYGISYGTVTGQMYAENFPHRVRAMLLDSVFDHSLPTSKFVMTEAATGEDSFQEFAKWCAANTACVLHGQDVGQVYGDLFAKATRGELPLPVMGLVQTTNQFFYGPRWADAAAFLKSLSEPSARLAEETAEFPIATACADADMRFSSEREWRSVWYRQREVAPTVHAHFAWGMASLCSDWPSKAVNPQHQTDVSGAPPILLMNSLHDPATGYAWATNVNRQLKGSVLLTYDGWGHGVWNRSECTANAAVSYLIDRKLPRPGTHCAAVEPTTAQARTSVF